MPNAFTPGLPDLVEYPEERPGTVVPVSRNLANFGVGQTNWCLLKALLCLYLLETTYKRRPSDGQVSGGLAPGF